MVGIGYVHHKLEYYVMKSLYYMNNIRTNFLDIISILLPSLSPLVIYRYEQYHYLVKYGA